MKAYIEAICHCDGETCPTEHVAGCPVETYDCQGNCDQCNNNFDCESSDQYDL